MFPPIECHATGLLDVGDGHHIYWEASGNPRGKPALYLHGGPGGGMMTGHRRRFDPDRFHVIAMEQRGCGRSRPLIIESLDWAEHTTQALIADIEALRLHLGIERFLVHGVSWGSTLALAYAAAHPDRVSELVLMCITTTSAAEVAWMTEGVGPVFPEAWARFAEAARRSPGERLIDAYYRRITSPDSQERDAAARDWCAWEDAHVSLDPAHRPEPRFQESGFRQVFASTVIHYWKHASFLPEGALIEAARRLGHIPLVMVHGRLDVSSPLAFAEQLHRAWAGSELVVIESEGHGGPRMVDACAEAIAGFQ